MIGVNLAQDATTLAVIPGPGLLFGLLLLAAIVGGTVARAIRVPRVVGYLLAGIGLKFLLYWFLGHDGSGEGATGPTAPTESSMEALDRAAAPLSAIKDLGLGIILFSIGSVFEARHLRSVGGKIFKIAAAETGLTFLLVCIGTAGVGLAVGSGAPTLTILGFAVLLGFAAIATAPAATLFVLREYDAKGPTTDTILSLVGINNVVCIVTFYVCFSVLAAAGVLDHVQLSSENIWLDLLTMIPGSIALGVALGFCLSVLRAKLALGETLLILVATLIVVGAGEGWLLEHHNISYNFLLTTICMGATFSNVAIDPEQVDESLQAMGRPILVGFFVMAGYTLHLNELVHLKYIGVAYVVCRLIGKVLGGYLGMRWSGAIGELRATCGSALLCQAAVLIGLAEFVTTYWDDDWARRFSTVALGSVVVFEICGPILIKRAVTRAGEVKAVTLFRRPLVAGGGASVLALTAQALLRTVGLGRGGRRHRPEPLQVRHIMRSNIKCLSADASFDEVLRFAERSRFNHFPVVDRHQHLVGVIHFSDIREILYNPFLSKLMTAVDLANVDSRVVPADLPMEEVFRVFQTGDVGSLPVVESESSRVVVGIVEQRDLLRAVHEHHGARGLS